LGFSAVFGGDRLPSLQDRLSRLNILSAPCLAFAVTLGGFEPVDVARHGEKHSNAPAGPRTIS